MAMRSLETDYLVVGAGAMGMAFTDALIDHADVHVTLVDRRHAAGGHWEDAYPFVQLHQASLFYGVASTVVFPTFLPIAALINLCLSNGEPEGRIGFKNGAARRIATQGFNLECVADTPVGSFAATKTTLVRGSGVWAAAPVTHYVSSGADYTPKREQCQYLVAILLYNEIESVT